MRWTQIVTIRIYLQTYVDRKYIGNICYSFLYLQEQFYKNIDVGIYSKVRTTCQGDCSGNQGWGK